MQGLKGDGQCFNNQVECPGAGVETVRCALFTVLTVPWTDLFMAVTCLRGVVEREPTIPHA